MTDTSTTIFHRGHVFDGHRLRAGHGAAVRGDRVVAVGPDDQVRAEVRERWGGASDVVDLGGGLLAPGFRDAHMHPLVGGLERLRCEMFDLGTRDEFLDAIARGAAANPHATWVRGGGWSVDAFDRQGPTAALLDTVVPDRPAFLPSTDHHDAWVNTRALEVCGIDRHTPDPPDGWIERDADGNPTGTLREAAMALVHDHVETPHEEYVDALREAQRHLHSWGVTGWHDALIGGYAGLDDPTPAYLELVGTGELTARVRCSQWWDRSRSGPREVSAHAAELLARRDELAAAGLDAGSVKVMMDGITETFTATLGGPGYGAPTGCPCGDHGLGFLDAAQAADAVTALDAAGLQVHVHAIGDTAVHDALDALEAARRSNGMRDLRHQVAHLQLVRPEDRARFGDLQVVANLQGMWALTDTPAVQALVGRLDEERLSWHYPFADILAGRARFSGGSDWPVNPPEPIQAVHALVNRRRWTPDPADAPPALLPDQAIGLADALSAYTRGSAWADHHEDGGFVHVGARADLVTLDRDPFAAPVEQIGACHVTTTWAAGALVHDAR